MTTSDPASSGRRRGSAAVVIGSVVLMFVVVAAASSLDEALWTAPETTTSETVVEELPPEEVDSSPQPTTESGSRLPDAGAELGVIAAVLLLAVIVLAVATVPRGDAGWSWASLSRRRRRRRLPSTPLPDMPRAVEPDDAAVRAALREGPPRNAIVRCWMLLEEDAAAAGIRRAESETSSEYVERVIGASSVDPQPIADLGALFREARFSSRPVDETHRAQAEEALTQTLASLGGRMEQRS